MKLFYSLLFLIFPLFLFSQNYNLELVGTLDFPQGKSDIWGYVDNEGTEYAIMGLINGTTIISLEDPANPTEVAYIEGGNSTWRDMKTYGHYAYITTEAADGLLVIDLSDIANGNISHNFYQPNITVDGFDGQVSTIHNLYIDENGFIYLAGSNMNLGGVLIFDSVSNPTEPPFVGACDAIYSHDVYVRNDTVWSSNVNSGNFSAIDVSDKANPVTLAFEATSFDFTHNAWLSDSGQYLFTTDEKANANIDAYDVSDINNIQRLDTWHPSNTAGTGVIPHNVHVKDDYLVISYYTDGVKVVDAHRPSNLVEVGSYDTYPDAGTGFQGCWGAYPFLPSGLVLASDMNTGLYVLSPTYQRACYLEGNITDDLTGIAINGVNIEIVSDINPIDQSESNGDYAMGQVTSGTFDVIYSAPGYIPQTIQVSLVNGEVTFQDVSLIPLVTTTITGTVVLLSNSDPIPDAAVRIQNEFTSYTATTDASGQFSLTDVYIGDYDIFAGKWGYSTEVITMNLSTGSNTAVVELEEGYQDPFAVDLGWEIVADANTGNWELGEPIGTSYNGAQFAPEEDVEDVGSWCYVTGNNGGGAGDDDVDGGVTTIISPVFDVSNYNNPHISFQTWFMNAGGNGNPDDALVFSLDNGTDEIIIQTIDNNTNGWLTASEYRIEDFITPTATMTFKVETSDFQGSGHLVEAGFDNFKVFDDNTNTTANENIEEDWNVQIFPNPFSQTVQIVLPEEIQEGNIVVYDIAGREIYQTNIQNSIIDIYSSQWTKGVYQLSIISKEKRIIKKIIKQ